MTETGYRYLGYYVPQNTIDELRRYAFNGVPLGGFLEAVVSNDLVSAVSRADSYNQNNLPALVVYVYNELPAECWGSRETYEHWLDKFRENTNE
jgi:hypothetical protein